MYGWAELLYEEMQPTVHITDWSLFPVQRNFEGRANGIFNCPQALEPTNHAGHFRIYLPGWAREILAFDDDRRVAGFDKPARSFSPLISRLASGLVILGDSNEYSGRGDYRGGTFGPGCTRDPCPSGDTSDIGLWCAGAHAYNEANTEVVCDNDPANSANCFSDRHSGGANYLLGDLHAEYSRGMRERLGCDWNMDGVQDAYTSNQRELCGCPHPPPE
jgi:prepilin-type processing-associated H-X9-DG protein